MGLTYHYKFRASAARRADELERFLKTVELQAKEMGFDPTMVLKAEFDSPERQEFARRLTHGLVVRSEALKGIEPVKNQVWSHNTTAGECRLIPVSGVALVATDEDGAETVFGFFKYSTTLKDREEREIELRGAGPDWVFEDYVKTAEPRFREIVRLFMEGGFVEEEEDDFAEGGSCYTYIPASRTIAEIEIAAALEKPLEKLSKREFLKAYCSVAYLYPGFHPDDWEAWTGPARIKALLAEAWRRADKGEFKDGELYPYPATKAAIIHAGGCRKISA